VRALPADLSGRRGGITAARVAKRGAALVDRGPAIDLVNWQGSSAACTGTGMFAHCALGIALGSEAERQEAASPHAHAAPYICNREAQMQARRWKTSYFGGLRNRNLSTPCGQRLWAGTG